MKKILPLFLGVVVIASLLLLGCDSASTTTTSSSPASTTTTSAQTSTTTPSTETAKFGGVLKKFASEPYSLGYPASMTGQIDGQTAGVCLEPLFLFDKNRNLTSLLATDYTLDSTAKTLTIVLRENVKFQDGSDFNATVCKWNLDQYRTGARPELNAVSSVDVVDDHTVRLNLSTIDNTLLYSLSTAADAGRMISMESFLAHGTQEEAQAWAEKNPVGTGAWQLSSYTKDVSIIWERFDGYWGGKPYIDEIQMVRSTDSTVSLMAFKSGEYQIAPSVMGSSDAKSMKEQNTWNMALVSEGQVPTLAGAADDPYFSNLKIRQAMSYAIDVDTMGAGLGQGFWPSLNQWAIEGTWGYNPNIVGYPYNPEKAKELLAEAGYPNGFDTTLHFYNLPGPQIDQVTAVQTYLQAVNINVTLDPMARPAFAEIASNKKGFTGIVQVQAVAYPDPLVTWAAIIAGNSFNGILIPQELKDVYAQAIQTTDQETKQQLVWELNKLASDEYCVMTFLFNQQVIVFKSKTLHDDGYGEYPYYYLSPKAWLE